VGGELHRVGDVRDVRDGHLPAVHVVQAVGGADEQERLVSGTHAQQELLAEQLGAQGRGRERAVG
jgi:hypothetical protein